jgi:hypothetical protein
MELQIDWTDPIECDGCDNRATHVQVGADDAENHSEGRRSYRLLR